jgi:hypothetical protein
MAGSGIRKKPIPDPGGKKVPDPGSATLYVRRLLAQRRRLDKSTALYIYKAKKVLVLFTHTQETKFMFK